MYIIYTKKLGVFLRREPRINLVNSRYAFHFEFGWFGFWISKV